MFTPLGATIRVPESQQDAVTALSGSGPAYFFYLVEAMVDAGILLGLPRNVAHDLIVQTAIGSAVMLRDSGDPPVLLREAVTSPAGTTINAIRELEKHGVRAALLAAGPTRLRPIIMTTMSVMAALLPIASGLEEGSELLKSAAVVLIGGLLTSTLLTLVFVPAMYTIFDDAQRAVGRLFQRERRARPPKTAPGPARGGEPSPETVPVLVHGEGDGRR